MFLPLPTFSGATILDNVPSIRPRVVCKMFSAETFLSHNHQLLRAKLIQLIYGENVITIGGYHSTRLALLQQNSFGENDVSK